MKLTAKQERMVREFIREAEQEAASLDVSSQRRAVNALRQRLKRELAVFENEIPRDEQVLAVLERCRALEPETIEAAPPAAPEPKPAASHLRLVEAPPADEAPTVPITDNSRIWAGVCAAWADRLEVDVRVVRGAFVAVGLLMPPLAFMTYLALYFELLLRSEEDLVPQAETGTLFLRALSTTVAIFALFVVGNLTPRIVIDLSTRFLPELTVRLDAWAWYQGMESTGFWFALFLAAPMSAVAAMPLRHDWDKTLRLFSQLVVALYAVFVSYGIAAGFVGAAIEIIEFLTR